MWKGAGMQTVSGGFDVAWAGLCTAVAGISAVRAVRHNSATHSLHNLTTMCLALTSVLLVPSLWALAGMCS